MKTTLVVLFTIFSLVGCPASKPPSPPPVQEPAAPKELPWLNAEYNRGVVVWVEYHVVDKASGQLESFFVDGIVVGSRAVVSQNFTDRFNNQFNLVQNISIRSASGDWQGIPAIIVASTGESFEEVVLLIAQNDLPNVRPAVFGSMTYRTIEGYRLEFSNSNPQNLLAVVPVFVEPSATQKWCATVDQSDPTTGGNAGVMAFDKKHRLVCVNFVPAQKVKRFLQANQVPFLEK